MVTPLVINQVVGANWALYNADSVDAMQGFPAQSVHLAVSSLPFANLYVYSPSVRDLGNVGNPREFFAQYAFLVKELVRVMVPGRTFALHCYDIQEYGTQGVVRGRYDFPGDCIRHTEAAGFRYMGRISVNKNPQAAATRNHPVELLFATLRRDAAKLVPAQADYVLLFHAPGDNPVPIVQPVDEETWIKWAHPVWTEENGSGLRETDVLPNAGSKENDDERHLAPLQLGLIERCIRLWSNPGETVYDPFAGIGSTPYMAVKLGRRGLGSELKPSYFNVACRFLKQAETESTQPDLFSWAESGAELAAAG